MDNINIFHLIMDKLDFSDICKLYGLDRQSNNYVKLYYLNDNFINVCQEYDKLTNLNLNKFKLYFNGITHSHPYIFQVKDNNKIIFQVIRDVSFQFQNKKQFTLRLLKLNTVILKIDIDIDDKYVNVSNNKNADYEVNYQINKKINLKYKIRNNIIELPNLEIETNLLKDLIYNQIKNN
jgi:hypothetical protein